MSKDTQLTPEDIALLNEPHTAVVATVMPDGTPQLTPVWIDTDGEAILFNTALGRVKPRNIAANPAVAVAVVDSANPYRWLSVRGKAEMTEEGAAEQIDRLTKKYLGQDTYPFHREDERRVTVRVIPEHRNAMH